MARASYREHVAKVAERQRQWTLAAQDIGELPAVADEKQRQQCQERFQLFCRCYFPRTFSLPWAPFHELAAERIERAVRSGGQFAFAMPRGQGKSSLCEAAAIWATLYGFRDYVLLVGATQADAETRLANIKLELESNDRLLADFPEVCYPIRRLERSTRRCQGQKYLGALTNIVWGRESIRFADVGELPASGSIIEVAGITGRIRGRVHKVPDGRSVRPSLAIVDDPQTRESAKSETQSRDREATIAGDIHYLAGPDEPMAVIMPCTVIYREDVADRLLNRRQHPAWQGERTKMVEAWPTNEAMWAQYFEIWRMHLNDGGDGTIATKFYAEHRQEMDEGAIVSWPERTGGCLSAIEHVMRLRQMDEAAFNAEYQNDPLEIEQTGLVGTPQLIAAKLNGLERASVPLDAQHLTAAVDVQQALLYWIVVAWRSDFTGWIIDYGTWPAQDRRDFTLQTSRQTLEVAYPGAGLEGRLFSGLKDLSAQVLSIERQRDGDGAILKVERCLIDANWAQSTQLVYQFCREFDQLGIFYPGHGKGIGAASTPWSEYKQRTGERLGHHWRIPPIRRTRSTRHVIYDTNFWKTFIHARWITTAGDPGALTLYGRREGRAINSLEHVNFASHQCAEYPVRTEGRGRTVDEWRQRPHRPDNHWFDCTVAAAVAASMAGVATVGGQITRAAPALPRITRDYLHGIGRL